MNKSVFLLFLMSITFYSCQEVIDVDLENTSPLLVVDGLISDQPGPYEIRLTTTDDFFSKDDPKGVDNARIIITDETDGLIDTLRLVDASKGLYQTNNLQGITEHTYRLEIEHEGTNYQGRAYMPTITSIDTLIVRYVDDIGEDDDGFRLFLFATEPQDEVNFYRFQTYKNGELIDNLDDITVLNDEAVGEDIIDVDLGYVFFVGDTVRFEMHSLTQEVYDYYNELFATLNNDGGLFSSPPANPKNNLSNGMLGIFRASAIEARTVLIQ